MNIDAKLVEKICGLLRLAESSQFDGEREKALLAANRLALEAQLNLAQLDVDKWQETKKEEEIIRNDLQCGSRFQVTQKYIYNILQKHFGVKIVLSGSRHSGRKICLIGSKTNVELASYANDFLNNEFSRRWLQYKKQSGVRLDEKNSFMFGISKGLDEKLALSENKFTESYLNRVKQDKGEQESNRVKQNFGLMVISNKERIEQEVKKHFPRLVSSSRRYVSGRHSESSMQSGYEQGKTININRPIGSGGQYQVE